MCWTRTRPWTDRTGRGFAIGWDYAITWLTVLPFEITAAGLTIKFWRDDINIGVWITVFLVVLSLIQIFGVRGYGEGLIALSIPAVKNKLLTSLKSSLS